MNNTNKYAALATASAKVNRLIIANIAEYAQIQELVEDFIANPTAEAAEVLDVQFNRIANGFEAVRNSIGMLANRAVSEDVDAVDVTFDERGQRLL